MSSDLSSYTGNALLSRVSRDPQTDLISEDLADRTFAVKDNIAVEGEPLSYGLENALISKSTNSASVVSLLEKKLLEYIVK